MPPSIPPSPAGGRGGERANQSFGLPSDSSTSVSHSNGQAQLYKLNPLCAILSASFAQQVLRWLVHQHTISCSSISSPTHPLPLSGTGSGVVVVTVRSNNLIERLRLAGYRHVPRGAAGLRPHDLKQLQKLYLRTVKICQQMFPITPGTLPRVTSPR